MSHAAIAIAGLMFAALPLRAQPSPASRPAAVEPALAPDAALLQRIAALPANTWLKLPPFKVVGELDWLSPRADERTRGPFGRDYSNHAMWCPQRQRALYCGGGHNVRPINDVWEYDLAANTWVCLRGADPAFRPTEQWFHDNAVLKDGVLMTRTGAPIRMLHTWDQFTYDPVRGLLLLVHSTPRNFPAVPGVDATSEGNPVAAGLGIPNDELQRRLCKDGIYLWGFDPARRRWTHVEFMVNWKGPGNTIGGRQESGILEYLPDRRTCWFLGYGGPLLRDAASGQWKRAGANHSVYGGVGVYDPDTRRVVIVQGRKTSVYDLEKDQWTVAQENAPAGGSDANCTLQYDPLARRVILYTWAMSPHLWLYDVAANTWTDPKPTGDVPPGAGGIVTYQDPARNVLVCYDSRDVYVYRCERSKDSPGGN